MSLIVWENRSQLMTGGRWVLNNPLESERRIVIVLLPSIETMLKNFHIIIAKGRLDNWS